MVQATSAAAETVCDHPRVEDILQTFCSTDRLGEHREWMKAPFSYGEYTYATNGHIAVRVARRPDVADIENTKPPQVLEKYFERCAKAKFAPIDLAMPTIEEESHTEDCGYCDGRGKEHDCPECACTCADCGGTGEEIVTAKISAAIFGGMFRLIYVRQILSIPGVEVADLPSDYEKPLPQLFRTESAVIALMPLKGPYDHHVDLSK